jgi:16S rRNA (guanine966-N2)-methyltransferase
MRIVGGTLRGRRLLSPSDNRTRPTSDRVRQAVFNIVEHGIDDFALERARVLDLFAGTGALGLEALSRGADTCIFVDTDMAACGIIADNIAAFGLSARTTVLRRDATALGQARPSEGSRQLVLLDPPYGRDLAGPTLASALAGGWIAAGALIVAEEAAGTSVGWPPEVQVVDRRQWGGTTVAFARLGWH